MMRERVSSVKYWTVGWNLSHILVPIPVMKRYKEIPTLMPSVTGMQVYEENPLDACILRDCTLFQAFGLFPEMSDKEGIWFPALGSDWMISRGIVSAQTIRATWDAIWEIQKRIRKNNDLQSCGTGQHHEICQPAVCN